MAFVKVRVPRTSQPQELVGVDWSNPLTLGIRALVLPGLKIDIVQNNYISGYRGSVPGIYGVSTDKSGTGILDAAPPVNASSPTAIQYDISGPITVLAICLQDTATNNAFQFGRYNGSSSPHYAVGLHGGSYSGARAQLGTFSYSPSAADSNMVGKRHLVTITGDGAVATVYYDGKVVSSGSYTPPTYVYDPSNSRALIIGSDGVGASNNTTTYLGAIWNRQLSSVEITLLNTNPWQIFESEERLIWIPDAVSVTLPTIGRPLSTITSGAWAATGGTGGLPGAINETAHSAAEYISVASASMCEMTLGTTAYPGGATQVLSYWASSTAGSTLTVRLRQSGATVASWTHPLTTADTLYQQTLTAPQIAALTSGAVSVQLETS
jgi:hypothetical protein